MFETSMARPRPKSGQAPPPPGVLRSRFLNTELCVTEDSPRFGLKGKFSFLFVILPLPFQHSSKRKQGAVKRKVSNKFV